MIHKRTVLILGAGASIPYGFPSGAELRNLLCDANWHNRTMKSLGDVGIASGTLSQFQSEFLHSGLSSIDDFLSRRGEYERVGKLAIAYELCIRERDGSVFGTNIDDDWYRLLWKAMSSDADTMGDLKSNQIRIVSFNYDRSLEFFLSNAIMSTFGVDEDTAVAALNTVAIIHPYGMLGKFGLYQAEGVRPYTSNHGPQSIELAANAIKVIPEIREESDEFREVRTWFEWSEQICFLGFGFDTLNIRRLGLQSVLDWLTEQKRQAPMILASAYKLRRGEIDVARGMLCGSLDHKWHSADPTLRNSETLREFGLLL